MQTNPTQRAQALLDARTVDQLQNDYREARRQELAGIDGGYEARCWVAAALLRKLPRADVVAWEEAERAAEETAELLALEAKAARDPFGRGELEHDDAERLTELRELHPDVHRCCWGTCETRASRSIELVDGTYRYCAAHPTGTIAKRIAEQGAAFEPLAVR